MVTTTALAMDVVSVTLLNAATSQRMIIRTIAPFIRSGGSQMASNLVTMTVKEDSAPVSACTRQDTRMSSEK